MLGLIITLESSKKSWVSFKYECLPNLCYWCGHLDHRDRDCALWIESPRTLSSKHKQYSLSLRAPPPPWHYSSSKKDVIFVPSFFDGKGLRVVEKSSEKVVVEVTVVKDSIGDIPRGDNLDMETKDFEDEINGEFNAG